jgi:hypothetical protein
MRDYGVVSPKFWIGGTGKSLRGNPQAQIVALYLMTSPHANMIGVFYCPLDTIAKETGLTSEGASEALQSLIEADFCQFDADTEEVFACRMAAYQVGEQLEAKDNRCKGVARELDRVMSERLKAAFRAIYSGAFHLPDPTQKQAPTAPEQQAPSEPLRSQKQEQKQEQEQKKHPSPAKLPTCPYDDIVGLYLELLPELPAVRVMDDDRKKGIRKRWEWVLTTCKPDGTRRAEDAEQALAWFRSYFELAKDNDFLMGRTKRNGEHANWKCDIDFLMTTRGLKQVLERTEAS